ncbi:MAG: hypothetical protein JWP26_2823 [Devosia sp.]|uniref:hypothetical protein n=1 Tax=Devosia sp. TaxID=1871048 RepID=UPI0026101DA8|nr:hypothetical protein [Devosia sp.]MDB5536845.1 hypothetical protein [Devosia sp.]MDB5587853.1 hypothetical protein [Devosia sp.]
MSKLSRTIPTDARSGRPTAPNLPAWMITNLRHAEAERLTPQALHLELPPTRPWADDPVDGESEGMLTLDL